MGLSSKHYWQAKSSPGWVQVIADRQSQARGGFELLLARKIKLRMGSNYCWRAKSSPGWVQNNKSGE